jgi:hypothetical protein
MRRFYCSRCVGFTKLKIRVAGTATAHDCEKGFIQIEQFDTYCTYMYMYSLLFVRRESGISRRNARHYYYALRNGYGPNGGWAMGSVICFLLYGCTREVGCCVVGYI